MAHVLIIGAGGVGSVVAHKCAQASEVFTQITLASRTVAKCEAIAASVKERTGDYGGCGAGRCRQCRPRPWP